MTTVHTGLEIGSIQTLVRYDDAVVRDHRRHELRTVPDAAYLDMIYRAAALHGLPAEQLELRSVRFERRVVVSEESDQRLILRSEPHTHGARLTVTAVPVEDGHREPDGVVECLLSTPEPSRSRGGLDIAHVRRAIAAAPTRSADSVYRSLEALGEKHGEFLRLHGALAPSDGRWIAQVSLDKAARRRRDDFFVHPAFLHAAMVFPFVLWDTTPESGYVPVSLRRFRAWQRSTDTAYLEIDAPAGQDALEADVRLFDADGQIIAEFDKLTVERVPACEAALDQVVEGSQPAPKSAASTVTVRGDGDPNERNDERRDCAPRGSTQPRTAERRAEATGRPRSPLDIAVVGMSGRYPDAEGLDEFWNNLEAGRDSVTEVPTTRWRPEDYPTDGRPLGRFGAFLSDVDAFDPLFFRIPPSMAAVLDPQERLFLQSAYAAVENSGYQPGDFAAPDNRVGVFVGTTWADYRLLGAEAARRGRAVTVPSVPSSIANRVSYYFGFAGPSMTVDTACSSSLTALHLACRSIVDGECDAAIVGGVNLILHPDKYLLLNYLNMVSSDGRCRSFGAGGDGYVPGEGVGALFLKPKEKALAAADTIHGVILGSAINHGGRAAGYTVPHPHAQGAAIAQAVEQSAVDPDSIGYIEAHGTGTALGDPIEIVGLHRAFGERKRPCALGSVKSNIGHLEAAAGIAAVTRALLQLRHGRITPSLHSTELNPEIDFTASPFYVPQTAEDWPRPVGDDGELPRRCGVSSFGAGGSNAHIVLEEHIAQPAVDDRGDPELLILSARSEERLREYAARLARHLRATERSQFLDIARTLQIGRPALEYRLALVASSGAEAALLLENQLGGGDSRVLWGAAASSTDAKAAADRYHAGDLTGAGQMWVDGATPDWTAINGGPRRRMPLPGYPFDRKRFWIEAPPMESATEPSSQVAAEPRIQSVADPVAVPSPGDDAFAATRQAFEARLTPTAEQLESYQPELDRYAAATVFARLREMGLPLEGGTVPELSWRLGIVPKFARFFHACVQTFERHGYVRREGPLVRVTAHAKDTRPLRDRLLSNFADTAPFIDLLDVCLDAYPEILRGQRPATDVLFPRGSMDLMAGIYRGNRAYDFYNDLLARFVVAAVRFRGEDQPVRILEIGSGTGGTTQAVLDAVVKSGYPVTYQYTDIGGSFVAHGRRTFGRTYPFVSFGVLDVEKDPAAQGFSRGSVDLLLAANALHAVADVDDTLSRVRSLLAPSGLLVLSEATAEQDVLNLTLGLLDGWHLYRDPNRRLPNTPLLSAEGWHTALDRAGFSGATAYGPGLSGDAEPSHRLIVASRGSADAQQAPDTPLMAEEGSDRHRLLEPAVAAIVAEGLGVQPDEIKPELSFAEYGVDSILAVNIVEQVNDRFGLNLKATVLFDHPSVRELTGHLVEAGAHLSPLRESVALISPIPETLNEPVGWSPAAFGAANEPRSLPATQRRPAHRARPQERRQPLDIAVIGMACRFPGANDYRELWRNLAAGHDAITEVPSERWNVADHFQPWPPAPGKTYSKWGGFVDDVDKFDPSFFNIVPAEADFMDPQQRLFLEESWKALEDAGIDARRLRRTSCGIFAGAPWSDYLTLIRQRGQVGSHHVFTGNSPAILTARVAYHLDVTGPSVGIDTACSSSLVAVQQACQHLTTGECDIALAGGVSVFVTPDYHQLASSLGMLSPVGRCHSFDEAGDGFVISEGVGVAVLKPLERALADGDPIHGVLKGIGVNQDGRTNGITAPSVRSQTELELDVYERFGIDPATIGYVEAHGTGTKLGDPIEVEALTAAFRRYTGRTADIPIGSIKTNIGHASHAAGMAGLFKVLLAMRERRIPPSLHFTRPNQLLGLEKTPFFVNTEMLEWPGDRRRAAVSSFGFSGTNAHLVVEEHVDSRPPTRTRSPQALVTLSARTGASLRRYAGELAGFLATCPDVVLHDVAATLQLGRSGFEHRLAILADSTEQLREQLTLASVDRTGPGVHRGVIDAAARPGPVVRLSPNADLHRTAQAWVAGESSDFTGLYDAGPYRRIHIPGYAFARERCWLPDVEASFASAPDERTAPMREVDHASAPGPTSADPATGSEPVLLAAVGAELGVAVAEVDVHVPSEDLGLDEVGKARTVEWINRELGLDLPIDVFTMRMSISELARIADAATTSQSSAVAPPQVPRVEPSQVWRQDLHKQAENYLIRLIATECRLPRERIQPRAPLQDYGVDSVLIANLNRRLEGIFGGLPSTLFFEYQTIRDLAGYFATEHAERIAVVTSAEQANCSTDAMAAQTEPDATATATTATSAAIAQAAAESHRPRSQDIAIIGMSGRYPMAADNDEFWANLSTGRDCIVEIPIDRWDHRPYLSHDQDAPGTTYARWGGFIDDVDKFDARFFNITPVDAEEMDPQQRLFLETSWAALEDGGYTPQRVRESARRRGIKDAGVFAGVNYAEYQFLVDIPISPYWAVANRVSYHFGFNGPSFVVDTACSASLTAVHLACQSLRNGECGYAIAGGVNISIHPGKFLLLGRGQWASSDGRCRTFGSGGDGYVPGEGVVALVLKPLADARKDGDRVYGVIRGSTINHDGRTNGFSVPNPNAQTELVYEALTNANIDARALSYVEAHGTGTPLGDPIEITGLTNAYRRYTPDCGYCAIGSAKGSIGHLEAAAGAAGLVKVLLQLQHGTIAPSPHADPPNPNIDFESSPFRVAREAQPWTRSPDGPPRVAAVSSFGAGGSNAHVIVEEDDGPTVVLAGGSGGNQLVVLSARRADRLAEQARNLLAFLQSERATQVSLPDIAWTLLVGRESFEHRLAIVVDSVADLIRRLEKFLTGNTDGLVSGTVRTHEISGGESDADRDYLRALHRSGELVRIAELWARGWAIDRTGLLGPRQGRIVSLPTYPFARERHWIDPSGYRRPNLPAAIPASAVTIDSQATSPMGNGAEPATQQTVESSTGVGSLGSDLQDNLQSAVTNILAELTKLPADELDLDADFLDFGFDSVTSVRMLNRLMKLYNVRIPATVIEEHNTIRSLSDHLVREELITESVVAAGGLANSMTTGSAPVSDFAQSLPKLTSAMPASTLPPELTEPARESKKFTRDEPFSANSVFITGVTGVLGAKLLHDLLIHTSTRISCLVRGNSVDDAAKRVRYFLSVYDPDGRLSDEFDRRVTLVLGDITRDRLGLNEETWNRLAAETDVTIHNAAKTVLVTFYESLAPINVEGTRQAIEFALQTKNKYLAYVSSFAALGDYLLGDNPPYTENDLELGQGYDHLPYQETKYHSEKLVRAATGRGLVWNIFRPGDIMGESTTGRYPFAEVSVKGAFYDFFKSFIESGTGLLTPIHWDITPVDYVSAGLLHLALRRPSYGETYHLTNPDNRSLSEAQDYIRDFGYDIHSVPVDEFQRMANERQFRRYGTDEPYNSQTIEMIQYALEVWGTVHYEISSGPDCTYTRAILADVGIECPTIGELVPVYLRHCIEVDYLQPPEKLGIAAAPGGAQVGTKEAPQ